MAQATITTLAGGRASVDIRISQLEQSKETEEIEPPDTPEEEEPTPEEEEAWGIGTGNAQVLSCDLVFQEAPLPTLPEIADLADAHPAIRDAIGCVHRGFSIYKPLPIDSAGNMKTPYEILGDEMCALLQSVHTYSVRCMNITYEYKTHRNMTRKCSEQKLGEKIDMTDLPKNKLGGKFGTRGQAYFLGRHIKYDNQEKVYIVEERYLVEIIPTLSEVKKKGHSDDE